MLSEPVPSSSRLPITRKPCRRTSQSFSIRKDIAMDRKKQPASLNRAASAGAAPVAQSPKPIFGETDCSYERIHSADFRGIDSMSLVTGKTLGSGTYAKVKAAWSLSRNELVSAVTSIVNTCYMHTCMTHVLILSTHHYLVSHCTPLVGTL